MVRRWVSGVALLAAYLGGSWPCLANIVLAQPVAPQPAVAKPALLHDRIRARYDGTIEANPEVEMRTDLALMNEARATGDIEPEDLARLKMLYGLALYHANRAGEGYRTVDEGVVILNAAGQGDQPLAIELMMNAASFVGDSGDRDEAARRLDRVLALQRAKYGPDSSNVGATLCYIAHNASEQGRLAFAIDQMRAGLARMKPDAASKVAWAANFETYAHMLGEAGRVAEFLEAARVAARIAQETLDPGQRGIGLTLTNLAGALNASGRYAEAEAVARQAIDIGVKYRSKGHGDTSVAMSVLADSLAAQGNSIGAEGLLDEAALRRAQFKSTALPLEPARYWAAAADLALTRGDTAEAERRLALAAQMLSAPSKGKELIRANLRRVQARSALIRGDAAGALGLANEGLAELGELTLIDRRVFGLTMLRGLALARLGRTDEAFATTEPTARALEADLTGSTRTREDMVEIAPAYAAGFARFALIALLSGHPDSAFRSAQLANLSSLAVTGSAVAARAAGGDPANEAAVRALDTLIDARHRLDRERSFALGKSNAEVQRLDRAMADADAAITIARTHLDLSFPAYAQLSRPRPVALAEAQAALAPAAALLLPLPLDDGVLSLVLTSQGLAWQQAPMRSAEFAAAIGRIRDAVQGADPDQRFPADDAYALYQALFPVRVAAAIGPKADLQLLGGGPLAGLPLGVLLTHRPARPWLSGDALRRAPWLVRDHSFAVVAALRAQSAIGGAPVAVAFAPRFAGIGAPLLGPVTSRQRLRGLLGDGTISVAALRELPSLPGTDRELRAIARATSPRSALLLLGADATETRVKHADLSHIDILAFATHGLVGGGANAEPALVLTPPDVATIEDDGLLAASEIAALRLNADWVILSACDSAGVSDAAVPTYSGLARAFFQAGSRSVLVSMWPLRDDIAARLTVAITGNARRMTKPRALQQAELALMHNASVRGSGNPALWAGFNLLDR